MRRNSLLGRISAFMLALTLAFTSIPMTAYAEDGYDIQIENSESQEDETDSSDYNINMDNQSDSASDNNIMDNEADTASDNYDMSKIASSISEDNDSISDSSLSIEEDTIASNDISVEIEKDNLTDNTMEIYDGFEYSEYYYVDMYEESSSDEIDPLFDVPYVSTYYFNPKPSTYDNIQIPLYITDNRQSEYLYNDTSARIDVIYTVDNGKEQIIENLPLGDYTLTIGKLSAGKHNFSVQTYDKKTGLRSHKLYNDLWVVNPSEYTISEAQTYYMTEKDLETYKINNNNSTNIDDLNNTRDGLTKLFADKQAAGYRKIVLLYGTYRINGEDATAQRANSIYIPSYFTVDMNGSTFKLNTITSDKNAGKDDPSASGNIVKFEKVIDAHLVNGILEGDRMERKALGLESGGKGEPINTITMKGGKYCSIENLTIKNTTGHTVFTQGEWGPNLVIKEYSNIAIINGKEIADSNCMTSSMMDLTEIINWDTEEDYMYVGHPEGYRGIKGDSAFIYVNFYDSNQKYLETVTGMQYRKMQIPAGAKYARVTIRGTSVSTVKYDSNTLSIYGKYYGEYLEFKNLSFIDTRTTAMSPSTCNNLLIEGCTYTRVGSSITPAVADFEDGWEECQDVYYRNNVELERAQGNTGTIIDNTGFNHIYENCTNHDFTIRYRVIGVVLKDMNDLNTSIGYQIGTKKRGKFGRIYDNNCGNIYVLYKEKENNYIEPVNFKIKDCTITSIEGNTNSYTTAVLDKVVYENCTFTCFGGGNATFVDCTIQLSGNAIWDNLYFKDCTFYGMESGKVNLSGMSYANRVFENCIFKGKTPLTNFSLVAGTFKNCKFEDLRMIACTRDADETILFEDCTINSSADTFVDIGPFSYSDPAHINLIFRNCTITHTGNKLITVTSKTTDGSQVLFDGCIINKDVDTSIAPNLIKVTNAVQKLATSIKGYTVSLNGDISLNYYIEIPDNIRNNSSAVVHFILPNGTTNDVKVSAGKTDSSNAKTYIYSCNVPAAYMTGNVSAQVCILKDGKVSSVGELYSYSVKEYANNIISNPSKYGADNVAMVKAMLNYGAYAQQYFGINTGNLANKNIYNSSNDPVLKFSQDLSAMQVSSITTKGDLQFYGASLVCKGETSLKLYFGSKSGAAFSSGRYTVSASIGGKKYDCSGTISNNMYVVTLTGIAAAELDDIYQFTITDSNKRSNNFTFNYSPVNYMANAQKSSDTDLINLTRAMFLYNQSANKCFNGN